MQNTDFPDRLISASQLRKILGGKNSDTLSTRGLDLLIDAGVIPPPLMLGRYRRWRWSTIDAVLRELEKEQQHDRPRKS